MRFNCIHFPDNNIDIDVNTHKKEKKRVQLLNIDRGNKCLGCWYYGNIKTLEAVVKFLHNRRRHFMNISNCSIQCRVFHRTQSVCLLKKILP